MEIQFMPNTKEFLRKRRHALLGWLSIALVVVAGLPSLHAQAYSVVHNFTGGTDGSTPLSGLTLDRAGNLYGNTSTGALGYGGVFKLKKVGSNFTFSSLYNFAGGNDGALPNLAPVVFGPNDTLYGTTYNGGGSGCSGNGCGIVFNLQPPPTFCRSIDCPWTEKVLYRFTGGADGGNASGALVFDSSGNIYGTARQGGDSGCAGNGCGTVYKLTHSGSNWTQNVIYSFTGGSDQGLPDSGVIFDSSGNIYGTNQGCYGNSGTAFELTPQGSGWTYNLLYTFGSDGGNCPLAGLIFDDAGNLYTATVIYSGKANELSFSGGSWTITNSYTFGQNNGDTCGPYGSLVTDGAGNFYGTTYCDGANGLGSVFKLTLTGGGFTYTDLHDFAGSDGANPESSVVIDSSGNLYGTASMGGTGTACTGGCGVVWEITP
jgi:uncharacterized repeat protein (TIGR03803 family)